jgi:hypothetical protein
MSKPDVSPGKMWATRAPIGSMLGNWSKAVCDEVMLLLPSGKVYVDTLSSWVSVGGGALGRNVIASNNCVGNGRIVCHALYNGSRVNRDCSLVDGYNPIDYYYV